MQQKNPFKALAVVVFLASIMLLGTLLLNTVKSPTVLGTQNVTENVISQDVLLTITDKQSQKSTFTLSYKAETNLFTYFKELQEKNTGFTFTYTDSSYGAFINSVNGYATDVSKEFWEIMINDKSAEVGMSAYIVKPGDRIELKISQIVNY